MKHSSLFSLVVLAFLSNMNLHLAHAQATAGDIDNIADTIIKQYASNVYTINMHSHIMSADNEGVASATRRRVDIGSGIRIDKEGHIVTRRCVAGNADNNVIAVSADGTEYTARVLGIDKTVGISVLAIDNMDSQPLPPITGWNKIGIDNTVIFLKRSRGSHPTTVKGTVIDIRRSDGSVIVDAVENPGTTGTPVFDTEGKLLGMLAFQVEGCAPDIHRYIVLPMEFASVIAHSIINSTSRDTGWLGISVSLIQDGMENNTGIVIQSVQENSPAQTSGLQPNDCIQTMNGVPVNTPHELVDALSEFRVGDTVTITVLRNTRKISVTTTLSEPPLLH